MIEMLFTNINLYAFIQLITSRNLNCLVGSSDICYVDAIPTVKKRTAMRLLNS